MEFDWTQGVLAEGLRRYNAREYFTAREAWETVWLEAHEPDKTFLQGLIQVAEAAPEILAHMNADHVDAMILLARSHSQLEATEATMTSVDHPGLLSSFEDQRGDQRCSHQLLHEVATPQEIRTVLVEMVR